MEIFYITLLFLCVSTLIFLHVKLHRKVRALEIEIQKQKVAVLEATSEIVRSLQQAFTQIKKNVSKQSQSDAKFNEYHSRLHRLEQHNNRMVRNATIPQRTEDNDAGQTEGAARKTEVQRPPIGRNDRSTTIT
jgi:hypothetical protein